MVVRLQLWFLVAPCLFEQDTFISSCFSPLIWQKRVVSAFQKSQSYHTVSCWMSQEVCERVRVSVELSATCTLIARVSCSVDWFNWNRHHHHKWWSTSFSFSMHVWMCACISISVCMYCTSMYMYAFMIYVLIYIHQWKWLAHKSTVFYGCHVAVS